MDVDNSRAFVSCEGMLVNVRTAYAVALDGSFDKIQHNFFSLWKSLSVTAGGSSRNVLYFFRISRYSMTLELPVYVWNHFKNMAKLTFVLE